MKPIQLVFRYAKKYRTSLILAGASMFALVGAQLLMPWIIRTLIASVMSGGAATSLIGKLTLAALGVMAGKAVLQFLRSYLAHYAGWGVVADVRKFIYEHMQRLSLRYYEDKQVGQLMSNLVNDTDLFEQLISHAVPDILVNAVTFIAVAAVLIGMNWKLTLLSAVPMPLILVSLLLFAKYVRPAFKRRQKELGDLNATLNDNLSGIREIKAFSRELREARRIHQRIDGYKNSLLNALKLMATFQPFIEFASSIGSLFVIYFGGRLALEGRLPVADLVAFFLYLEMFYSPIRGLGNAWEAIQSSLAGADRVAGILSEAEEPHTAPGALRLPGRVRGDIRFEDVGFSYTEGNPVLEGISIEIPANTSVALVGPTGVGKSTLVSLIPRFYEVSSGRLSLDGRDIRDIELGSLRTQISLVLQDIFLFYGTVRENILFGREDATENDMVEAAKAANAHPFIESLPEGYDTLIGERGIKLSGGQKQRLSIARALLKDAPILILDEATSSVDIETEILIQEALQRLMKGRTTILIAHRLSTVRHADKIIVLDERTVRETGRHEELMEVKNGYYKRLIHAQKAFVPLDAEGNGRQLRNSST